LIYPSFIAVSEFTVTDRYQLKELPAFTLFFYVTTAVYFIIGNRTSKERDAGIAHFYKRGWIIRMIKRG